MEYKLVSSDLPDFLSGEVSALLNSGWELHGSPVVFNKTPGSLAPDFEYVQAMVRRTLPEDRNEGMTGWSEVSAHATRQHVLQEARDAIVAWIKPGDLGGNGWDNNARRNGMILAVNIIDKLMDDGSQER